MSNLSKLNLQSFDWTQSIVTPVYVLDVAALKRNLARAAEIKREAGCKILLATKAFSLPAAFPIMREVLDGTTASGEYEARLGHNEFGKEVHVYSPAYAPSEVKQLTKIAQHIYFNSPQQIVDNLAIIRKPGLRVGIRINPCYSNAALGGTLYDPCAPNSRFGATRSMLDSVPWNDVDILHTHALCESGDAGSIGLIKHVARAFGDYVHRVKTVNFGGGHFINKPGYDISKLIAAIRAFKAEFNVDVVLEPGAGLVVDTGYLVASVLGLHHNVKNIAILDASASTHMPDVLEASYTPMVIGAAEPGQKSYSYILAGKTCMTGDIIGEYSFDDPLKVGDRIIFTDMMQYSFVKNNTFNGMPLPDLAILKESGIIQVIQSFDYDDFRHRLG